MSLYRRSKVRKGAPPLNLFLSRKSKWARSITSAKGLSLVMSSTVEGPCTNGTQVKMPIYKSDWKPSDVKAIQWEGSFIHEMNHNEHQADFDFLKDREKEIKLDSTIHDLMNCLTDLNVDRKEYGKFSGRDKVADARIPAYINTYEPVEDVKPPIYHKLIATRLASFYARLTWSNYLQESDINPKLSNLTEEWLDKIIGDDEIFSLFTDLREDGEPCYHDAVKLMEFLEIEPPECNGEGDGEGEICEDGGNGKGGKDSGDSDEEEESEDLSGDGDDDDDSEESDEVNGVADEGEGDADAAPELSHGEEGGQSEGNVPDANREPDIVDYEELKNCTGKGSLTDPNHIEQLEHKNKVLHINYMSDENPTGDLANYVLMEPNIHPRNTRVCENYMVNEIVKASSHQLPKKIKRELRVISQAKWQGNQSKGRINKKQVAGIATRTDNRPFKKIVQKDILDVAISLLVDHSGSMEGEPYIHACAAACMLEETFSQLQIPTEITGFTNNHDKPDFIQHKKFGERVGKMDLIYSFGNAVTFMGANPDGEAIMFALDSLAKRKEKRRMLFVISDGSPAFGYNPTGDIWDFTKHVIANIEKNPLFEIYGIGIMDDNPKELYTHHLIIDEAEELELGLLNLIKDKILRK